MNRSSLNLAWELVPRLPIRRRCYQAMLAYLAVCVMALAGVLYLGLDSILSMRTGEAGLQREIQAFRTFFQVPTDTLAEHAETLGNRLETKVDQIETVNRLLDRQVSMMRILAGLSLPLPPDVVLQQFEMDRSRGRVQFDLRFPAPGPGEPARFGDLAATWEAMPELAGQLTDIRTTARQTQNLGDDRYVILRWEAALAQGGS